METVKCTMSIALSVIVLLGYATSFGSVVWNDWTAGNEVISVRQQSEHLYVGSGGGLVIWDLAQRCYEKYDARDGIQYNNVTCAIPGSDGTVWVGIPGAVVEIRGGIADTSLNLLGRFDSVSDMEFDQQGRLWIGTDQDGGLYCYDGERLLHEDFGMALPWTRSVAVHSDGSVWVVAGEHGLMHFAGEEWRHHPLPEIPPLSDSLASYAQNVEIDQDGVVWTTVQYRPEGDRTEYCLCRFEDGSWSVFAVESRGGFLMDMAVDGNGTIWFALSVGLAMFDGDNWNYWRSLDGESLSDLTGVCASRDGTGIWVARGNEGLLRIEEGLVEAWLTDDPISTSYRCKLALEGDKVWVGMDHASLASYENGRWGRVRLLPEDSPVAPDVKDLTVGPDGTKWVCCPGVGLIAYDGETTIYDQFNSPLKTYYGPVMASQNGTLWVYDRGLWSFDGQSWSLFNSENGFPLSEVAAMEEARDGTLWFGGNPGACSFDGSVFEHYNTTNSALPSSYVTAIACAPDGRVYFGSYDFLACFDGDNWSAYSCQDFGMMPGWVKTVTVSDEGVLWLSNGFEGLRRFDGISCSTYSSSNSPLVSTQVDSVISAANGIWVSTGGGISFRQAVDRIISLSVSINSERVASKTEEPIWPDIVFVRAGCTNEVGDVWGDVYLWVECPNGSVFFLPSLSMEPARLARKVHFTEGLRMENVPVFSCDVTSVPPGRYTFKMIIMNRNSTSEPLSNIASCEWQFE